MTKHGLASALQVATGQPRKSLPEANRKCRVSPASAEEQARARQRPDTYDVSTYDVIVGALAKLLVAAEVAGSLKSGLNPEDVMLLFAGLFQMDPSTDWIAQSARLYDLVLKGLQVDRTSH